MRDVTCKYQFYSIPTIDVWLKIKLTRKMWSSRQLPSCYLVAKERLNEKMAFE